MPTGLAPGLPGTARRRAATVAGLSAAALLSAPSAARALDCKAPPDQMSMTICAGRDFAAADAALNAGYGQVMARLKADPEVAAKLAAAQRAWLAFRDAECAFATAGDTGGSAAPMVAVQCRARLTRARTGDLKAYLACHEGDLDCPVPPP